MQTSHSPIQNVGIGLRAPHIGYILENRPKVPWFEVLTDNYLQEGGLPLHQLQRLRADYPIVLHGVGLSLGTIDPLNWDYLKKLKQLIQRLKPAWISDHLCWVSAQQRYFHELLPLPYTEEALQQIVQHIHQVQDFLEQPILVENVSSYLSYHHSTLSEWEFINQVAAQADCFILLDINNIFVSATNQQFNPHDYLAHLNPKHIRQFHLGGYQVQPHFLLDAHNAPIHEPVWKLYEAALARFGNIPTLIEWDSNIPEFTQLQAEVAKAQQIMQQMPPPRIVFPDSPIFQTAAAPTESTLQQLQIDFATALAKDSITPLLQSLIRPTAQLSITESIAIYRDSMIEALLLTLTDIYPVCQQLVGNDFFRGMALHYIKQPPYLSPDLSDYGLLFAEFIAQFPPAQQLSYLADIARLEWTWWTAWHHPEIVLIPADWASLSTMPATQQSRVIFKLPAIHYLLTSTYPIQQIWQMHQDNSLQNSIHFDGEINYLLIWRDNFTVKVESLTCLEWKLLQALQQQQDLATLSEIITQENAATDIAQILPHFMQRGWIIDFFASA
jgi:uncharacterized protein (UPF0276 family)